MPQCKYCQQEKKLIKAHILPRNFYTNYKEKGFWGIEYKKIDKIHFQSGVIDKNILCKECDNHILGKYDNEAYRILLNIEETKIKTKWKGLDAYVFDPTEFNYEYIRKFFIAFLWKASISKLPCMDVVDLGPYEKIALDILQNKYENENLFKIIIFKTLNDELKGAHTTRGYKNILGQSRIYSTFFDSYHVSIIVKYKKFPKEFASLEELFIRKDQIVILESNIINKFKMDNLLEFKKFLV